MIDPARLAPRDLRRLVGEMWDDPRCDAIAAATVEEAYRVDRKSCDRALVLAWLRHFPGQGHPGAARLAMVVASAAERRDWPWRDRGRRFRLWDAEVGPAALGEALLAADDPAAVLGEAGIDGDLAAGLFVEEALADVCESVGATRGGAAERLGSRLIALFDALKVGGVDALLAYGLLAPWVERNPDEVHRKAIGRVLVARIGDPRLSPARWTAVTAELRRRLPRCDPDALVALLRRWLTQATVRAFFRIVGRTTDRKDQWDAREAFWLGYLDAAAVTDAWFAFGRRAEVLAGALAKEEDVRFARVNGGADPSHSALLLTIGDLRIAEWSHTGACRFWPGQAEPPRSGGRYRYHEAPSLYEPSYDGSHLRTMVGPPGFEHHSHVPVPGWERKFARVIYQATGQRHPVHGTGA